MRFVHMGDLHVVDDESPGRSAIFDDDEPRFRAAARPQEGLECRVVQAVVRTINALHERDPVDFVLVGGDAIDNAQSNELAWVLSLLDGAPSLACDSGSADPDVPGKEPFVARGLVPRWLWVTGNHDVLVQGVFPPGPVQVANALGTRAGGGTRDYRVDGGAIVQGQVVSDPRREPLTRGALMRKVAAHLGSPPTTEQRAYYTYDQPGTRLRFLVLDTAAETGGAQGIVRRADLRNFVVRELARADAEGRWVVLVGHHPLDTLGDGHTEGSAPQPDAVPGEEVTRTLLEHPSVIALLVAHGHAHRVRRIGTEAQGFWEIETASIVDYPNEFRVVEIDDSGVLRSLVFDYVTDGDTEAAHARDLSRGDRPHANGSEGAPEDRNVELWFRAGR